MKSKIFWLVTPCVSMNARCFGGTYRIYLRGGRLNQVRHQQKQAESWAVFRLDYSSTRKMEVTFYSDGSVDHFSGLFVSQFLRSRSLANWYDKLAVVFYEDGLCWPVWITASRSDQCVLPALNSAALPLTGAACKSPREWWVTMHSSEDSFKIMTFITVVIAATFTSRAPQDTYRLGAWARYVQLGESVS
jgi:hypothetical protein